MNATKVVRLMDVKAVLNKVGGRFHGSCFHVLWREEGGGGRGESSGGVRFLKRAAAYRVCGSRR